MQSRRIPLFWMILKLMDFKGVVQIYSKCSQNKELVSCTVHKVFMDYNLHTL